MGGVAILNPRDCLKHPLSHMKYPRNPSSYPNKQKKPPVTNNRTRRSPPRNQATRSPPPIAPPLPPPRVAVSPFLRNRTVKKSPNNTVVVGQMRILKRGEEIPKKTSDLGSTRSIVPDPCLIPIQGPLSRRESTSAPFYAGPVTMTSPPPSDVPLPGFFTKKSVSLFQATDATIHLIKMLRLDDRL